MDLDRFTNDDSRRLEGVRVELGDGAWVRLAHWMNPRHAQALEKRRRGKVAQLEAGLVKNEEALRLGCEAMAEGILLDWGGITEKGEPLAYARETAARVLFEKTGLRDFVMRASQDAALFAAGEDALAGKD